MKIRKTEVARILLITLSNVGDAILTLPVLDALASEFPEADIDVLLSPGVIDVFEKDKRISRTLIYTKHSNIVDKIRLIGSLMGMRYDLVVDLKNTMIPIFLLPRYRTEFLRRSRKRVHKKDEHLLRINDMGIEIKGAKLEIDLEEISDKMKKMLNEYITSRKYIVVSAGAKSHLKRWPVEKFSELCDRIVKDLGYGVVLIGKDDGVESSDSDRVIVGRLIENMEEKALDLIGRTNIRESACIIKSARALVTNDSAPLHIGSAVNTPTIAVFGPTDGSLYGPLAERSVILRKNDLGCAPCGKAKCDYNYECLRSITVDEVFDAVKRTIKAG